MPKAPLPARPMPRTTAQVAPYVECLGAELTVRFLLAYGGAELYLADDPTGRAAHVQLIGEEKAKALAAMSHRLQKWVPLGKRWLAAMLHWQGHSAAHIARTLRVSDVSVRRWLNEKDAPR